MKCVKAHALGNDFILIKSEFLELDIKTICNRKFGIGANQVLLINENNEVKIWNQDGSTAKMCANGLRALAQWLGNEIIEFKLGENKIKAKLIESKVQLYLPSAKIENINEIYLVDVLNLHKIYITPNEPKNFEEYANNDYNVSCAWVIEKQIFVRTWERGVGETFACGSAAFAIASVFDSFGFPNLNINFKYGTIEHIKENDNIIQIGPAHIVAEIIFL